jgi:hypothetical protein
MTDGLGVRTGAAVDETVGSASAVGPDGEGPDSTLN